MAVALPAADLPAGAPGRAEEQGRREAFFDGERTGAAVVRGVPRELAGPAIVELEEATLVVPPGWSCAAADDGTLVMERH